MFACSNCHNIHNGGVAPRTFSCPSCGSSTVIRDARLMQSIQLTIAQAESEGAKALAAASARDEPVLVLAQTDRRVVLGLRDGIRVTIWDPIALLTVLLPEDSK